VDRSAGAYSAGDRKPAVTPGPLPGPTLADDDPATRIPPRARGRHCAREPVRPGRNLAGSAGTDLQGALPG